MGLQINKRDLEAMQLAMRRSPEFVKQATKKLFVRVGSHIDRFMATDPWRMNGSAGGVPYATGELFRNSRNKKIEPMQMKIYTNLAAVPYGVFVHQGTSKMKARPYYESAMDGTKKEQDIAIGQFLDEITSDLAK